MKLSLERRLRRLEELAEARKRPVKVRARFSVVQLVPDPIAGEYVNVAVVVVTERGGVIMRQLDNWGRACAFAGDKVDAARRFCDGVWDMSPEDLQRHADHASGVVQMTPWQPSLEYPARLLTRLARRYLKDAD